ncbi:MAG: hypothetical protein ACFFEW_18290 [Candidatus Thorarchaeota archaeon]
MNKQRRIIAVIVAVLILSLFFTPIVVRSSMNFDHTVWSVAFGGINYDEGSSIVPCDNGGYVMSGRTQGFEVLPHDDEVWLVHCDQDGNHLWNRTYGGGMKYGGHMSTHHHSVTVIKAENEGFLLTSHTTNFGPGDVNGWLIHTDGNGIHLWNHTYGGASDEVLIKSARSSDGGYVSVGFSENITAGIIDGWIIRTDADGQHIWNSTCGVVDIGEIFTDVIEINQGGFLIAGYLGGFSDFEDRSGAPPDVWLYCIDADGNHLWNRTYGGSDVDGPNQVIQCTNEDFAIFGGTASFGAGNLDAWLLRVDHNGNHLWNQTYGGENIESGFGVAECQDGGFALFTLSYTDAIGTSDAWIIRTDSSGTPIWDQKYVGDDFDQFWGGICIDDAFVAVGITKSFGSGHVDMWVTKIPDRAPSIPIDIIQVTMIGTIVAGIFLVVVIFIRRR